MAWLTSLPAGCWSLAGKPSLVRSWRSPPTDRLARPAAGSQAGIACPVRMACRARAQNARSAPPSTGIITPVR